MNITRYNNAQAFCDRVLPCLLQHEAENNLMIGIMLRLADGTGRWGDEPPVFVAVEEQGQVVAAALQTPPYNLQLTRMEKKTITSLVEFLRAAQLSFPGVLGPEATVKAFITCWSVEAGLHAEREMGLGVYQLASVIPPRHPGGISELATQADAELLIEWITDFNTLTGSGRRGAEEIVRQGLKKQQYWLWKHPHPVSLAAYSAPTPHGIRVNGVYTPPEHRGMGYASANVAALSQYLLDSGRQFCYLFTDLANPTSNSIYQKIGYQRVCDFVSYRFAE